MNCLNHPAHHFSPINDAKVNAWMTLFDEEFNNTLSLYHYTSFETACKIIYGESFRFSSLSNTNDPIESKPKISTNRDEDKLILNHIMNHFETMNKDKLQLLCFCKDTVIPDSIKKQHSQFSDYTGRGFALPRMWAQYANNNKGVCFIIDKVKLLNDLQTKRIYRNKIIHSDDVSYKSFFESYSIKHNDLMELNECINDNSSIIDYQLLMENLSFIKYNYFKKSRDWQQENEFRILGFSENPIYINDIYKYILGIIVGEKMEEPEMKMISLLVNNKFDIKKIKFNYNACSLENLTYKDRNFYA